MLIAGAGYFLIATGFCPAAPVYPLSPRAVAAGVTDDLSGASGVSRWEERMASEVGGMDGMKIANGKAGGQLIAGGAARFGVAFPDAGVDLDFGFRDFVDVDLQLPSGFAGKVMLEFSAEAPKGGEPLSGISFPPASLKADGAMHRYRLDVGLVPRWRGFLTRMALVVEAGGSRVGTVAVGRVRVGDRPGDTVEPNLQLNLKPGMKIGELRKVESKHGCIWWHPSHEKEGFDPEVMPRRALRMLEETWQTAVNLLGYRDPCLGENPASTRRRKINHITWHGGFWMSGGDPPHFNVSEGGLRDEGWGNPVPHEFSHTVQAGQLDFLNGCHWESHANYLRCRRNQHFGEYTGRDAVDFGVLLRSNYFQDHPRLIYADYRPYFYLDGDPDRLGLPEGMSGKLWRTGKRDEYLWERLAKLLPAGVGLDQVAAGMARSWVTFDFPGGDYFRDTHFGADEAGKIRWFRYMAPLEPVADRPGAFAVPLAKAPMKFGWCVHELKASGPVAEADLTGIEVATGADWRWGFVALRDGGSPVSSAIFKPGPGRFNVPPGAGKIVLFVVATPNDPGLRYPRPTPDTAMDRHPEHRRYPYEISIRNAAPAERIYPANAGEGGPHPNGGGFVARTATVAPEAYISRDARVLDRARVLGNARVLDRAVVREGATVRDRAVISGNAVVSGEAVVSGDARVRNHAVVSGRARVLDRARVGDLAELGEGQELSGDAWCRGVSAPIGNAKAGGFAILDGDYAMDFTVNDGVHFHHIPWGGWYFEEFAAKLTKPRGLVAAYPFDETAGGQVLDRFGALHAVVRGKVARSAGAIRLDGAGQYVVIDPSVVDSPAATWTMVVRPIRGGGQPVFSIGNPSGESVLLGISGRGEPTVMLKGEGNTSAVIRSNVRVGEGNEVMLGLRMDGKRAELFVDGKPAGSADWGLSPSSIYRDPAAGNGTRVFLGIDPRGVGGGLDISDFAAYNIALDDGGMARRP